MARRRKPKLDEVIGVRIREARKRIGLTQEEFASRAGTAANVISRIENGERGMSLAMFLDLAQALGMPPGVLLEVSYAVDVVGPVMLVGEDRLVAAYRALGEGEREIVLRIVRAVRKTRTR